MKKKLKLFKRFIYSRVVFCFLLLAMQICMYLFFIIKFSPYFFYFAGVNLLLSFTFMAYLSNCEGKNEFKIAWLLPTMIFPLFGISLYIYTKMATRNARLKNKIEQSKIQTWKFVPKPTETKSAFPEISDLAFYLYESGNFPVYTDSDVEYFSCGEDFFPDFMQELKNAKEFIFLEFFIITPDDSWQKILEILKQKVTEGVEVRVLYDGIGSVLASTKVYHKYLASLGIKSKIYMPLTPVFNLQQNNRDHRKIAVIDGKISYTGGLNLANEYFNFGQNKFSYWKDSAVKIRGNATKTYTALFLQMWNLAKFPEKKFNKSYEKFFPAIKENSREGLLIPYADNAYNEKDIAENICLYILSKATKNVCITTPYIIIDNQLKSALIFAASRGINVSLIVPSKPDHFLTFCIGKTFLKTLVENGVHVYLYLPGFIHSKLFTSDGKIATVGSINIDYRSLFHHFEDGLLIYKKSVIEKIQRDIELTKLSCKGMTLDDYKKLPLIVKMLGRIFRIFAPLV